MIVMKVQTLVLKSENLVVLILKSQIWSCNVVCSEIFIFSSEILNFSSEISKCTSTSSETDNMKGFTVSSWMNIKDR